MVKSQIFLVNADSESALRLRSWLAETRHICRVFAQASDIGEGDSTDSSAGCIILFLCDESDLKSQFESVARTYLPVLATHPRSDPALLVRLLHAGAVDFLSQPLLRSQCLERIDAILDLDRKVKAELSARNLRLQDLTEREREVLELLVEPKTTVAIANRLEISPKTVEKHRTNILTKLNVAGVPELIRLALTIPRPHYSVSLPRLPLESCALPLWDGGTMPGVAAD